MDFSRIKNIYMIGIKGVGMTMLAQFLSGKGFVVSGSDTEEKYMTDQVLSYAGIAVKEGFDVENIPEKVDLIIYSTAYNSTTNPEVAKAIMGRSRSLTYAEALAEVFNTYYGVAVVGSHGKTTTTAWLGYVLDKSGKSPNVMVGSRVPQFNGASLMGTSDILVAEADEYQNKLKYFQPKIVLLNNIDYDHPDYYKTEADYIRAFIDFIKKIPSKGALIANIDDQLIKKYARVNSRCRFVTYGLREEADLMAYDLRVESGKQYFKVRMRQDDELLASSKDQDDQLKQSIGELGDFSITLSGHHNIYNALAVIAASIELGVSLLDIRRHIGEFLGTARRFELMGEYRGVKVFDDYAHHPAEIRATLAGARQRFPRERLTVVFHPHTYSRTIALLDQFAESFALADELIVLDIYGSAREQQGGVHSEDLIKKIEDLRPKGFAPKQVHYIPDQTQCIKYLEKNLKKGEVLLLIGAGDVFRIGQTLVNK